MKEILENLYQHKTLSKLEAKSILIDITKGIYNEYQIASFLTAFLMRNITLDEIKGFREGLLEQSIKIDLSEYNPIEVCGTGGDSKNTFNISTLTAFVLAGAKIPVAKHGNYGVSSVSGSSNVLEQLNIKFTTDANILKKCLKEASICFLHAPLFHPAMKTVAPVRKALGVKTFFNMLGPLVNPAQPKVQYVGVFSLELARIYCYLFQTENIQFTIVHSLDGFDEVSLTGSCKVINNLEENIYHPEDWKLNTIHLKEIDGGSTVEKAAEIFMNILKGKGSTAQNNVVLVNSAFAIQTYFPKINFYDAFDLAKESLFHLKALKSFQILKEITYEYLRAN